jgi:hypothetical protein
MRINLGLWGLAAAMSALIGLGHMAACTGDTDQGVGGASGSTSVPGGTGGAVGATGGTGGSTAASGGLACAKQTVLTKPGVANFDSYDGASDLTAWSFALGDDSSTGIFAGTFGYGDRTGNKAETFDMTTGHSAPYALRVADSMAQVYGGGMGIWLSGCLDAHTFSGVSFWVRGVAPTATAKLSLLMKQTTPSVPAQAGYKTGTCPGVQDTSCVHPKYEFEVTDTWTQVKVPWAAFTPGDADGTAVPADGSSIWQLQFDIGLVWTPDANGTYVAVPGAYQLVIDDIAFY